MTKAAMTKVQQRRIKALEKALKESLAIVLRLMEKEDDNA